MPGGDRTGPGGLGPMTGRGAGQCAGNTAPGFANRGQGLGRRGGGQGMGRGAGLGRGPGMGGGRGWRNMFHLSGLPGWMRFGQGGTPAQPGPVVDERLNLEQQAEALKAQLEQVNQRMSEIDPS